MHYAPPILLIFVATASAFAPSAFLPPRLRIRAYMSSTLDEIDTDAPIDRIKAVGNVVRSGEGHDVLDHEPVVDDESSTYMSKDGFAVDLDPLHKPSHAVAHSNDETDFDAPMWRTKEVGNIVRSGEGHDVLDHEPIVDDECYMGKDNNFADCVDFDPPHKPSHAVAHSNSETDFDAPMWRTKEVGNIVRSGEGHDVLDHEPVVDDESTIYMSKDGFAVDLDPLHKPSHAVAHSNDETDFDAPMWRNKEVGNIVRSGEGHDVLDHEPVVDDESTTYMSKDGFAVDLDPLHKPSHAVAHSNDETDFDAPMWRTKEVGNIVRSGEGHDVLDHEPVVDDASTVHFDKHGNAADFDPLHKPSHAVAHSNDETDFDAPLWRRKEAGNIVYADEGWTVDHEPVVDDECYTGKDGTATDCVDFDPLHP